MMYQCQFGENLAIDTEDRQGIFRVIWSSQVTLKIRSRSPKSYHLMMYLCQSGQNLATDS